MTALVGRDKYRYVTGWPDQVALSRILSDICKDQGIATMSPSARYCHAAKMATSGLMATAFSSANVSASFFCSRDDHSGIDRDII